jgi:hypothetical protein
MIGNLQITTKSGKMTFSFKFKELDNLINNISIMVSSSQIDGNRFYEEPNSGDLFELIMNLGLVLGKPKKFDYFVNCNFIQNKVIINKYKSGKIYTSILNKEFVEIGDSIFK